MDNRDMKIIDNLEEIFYQYASSINPQEDIEKSCVESMKDLQKIMYYMEVRDAMKQGEGYEDEYMNDMEQSGRSYNGGRYYNSYNGGNMYGRGGNSYTRGGYGYGRFSGRRGNPYMNGRSGRRSYDNEAEKENSVNDLRQWIAMEQDPEKRSMLESVMHVLENDK